MQYIRAPEKCLGADQIPAGKHDVFANLAVLGIWCDPHPHANQAILTVLAVLDLSVNGS